MQNLFLFVIQLTIAGWKSYRYKIGKGKKGNVFSRMGFPFSVNEEVCVILITNLKRKLLFIKDISITKKHLKKQ